MGKEIISIKGVPAYVCRECGEAYFTSELSRKIDRVMRDFHEGKLLTRLIASREIRMET